MAKLSRGSFAILTMVFVAFGLAIFASWFRYRAGDDALRFWGNESALRIRTAETVTLQLLPEEGEEASASPPSAPIGNINIEGVSHIILKSIDISSARGLIHARHAILEDASLDLTATAPPSPHHWDRIVKFTAKDGAETTLAINLDTGWICRPDTGALIKLNEPHRSFNAYIKKLAPRQKDIEEEKAKAAKTQEN